MTDLAWLFRSIDVWVKGCSPSPQVSVEFVPTSQSHHVYMWEGGMRRDQHSGRIVWVRIDREDSIGMAGLALSHGYLSLRGAESEVRV